jgi:hypothetical protein
MIVFGGPEETDDRSARRLARLAGLALRLASSARRSSSR